MSSVSPSPSITTREQAVVESWSQGFNVGGIVILILLVLCNYRRNTLLHKLIIGELLLALGHGFFSFFEKPEYGWILSSTAALLYISYFVHNLISWLKIRPFLPKWGARAFIITLLIVQPYWILETWANFEYNNQLGSKLFNTSRLLEPLFRDPWWVFTTIKLVLAINENYEFTIPGLIRTSPRFGIMLLCLLLSIIFLFTDVIFMIVVSKRGGMNPFWRLALVFKCASDVIFLDDFKSVLDHISESAMRKITTFEYRDNVSSSLNPPASTSFSSSQFHPKSSRLGLSSRAEMGSIIRSTDSRDDGHYEYAPSSRRGSADNGSARLWHEDDIPLEPVKAKTRFDQTR